MPLAHSDEGAVPTKLFVNDEAPIKALNLTRKGHSMNPNIRRTWTAIGTIVGLAALLAVTMRFAQAGAEATSDHPATPMAIALGAGSTLWLEGTSSLHDFESRTSDLTVVFSRNPASREPADAAGLEELIRGSAITGLEVKIPIASMRSGKSGLDRNLQKALKADQFPVIRFGLSRYALNPGGAGRDTAELKVEGSLSIAGHERSETLVARAYRSGPGVWIEGRQALRMTDFEIRPPTMMLGALKVADLVTIHYRLLLAPASAGTSAQSSRTN